MTAALPRALSREIDTAAGAGTLLVAVDYDGTLAHLVTNPRLAVPDSKAARAVLALAELPRTPVAIVTGRDRDDLRAVAPALAPEGQPPAAAEPAPEPEVPAGTKFVKQTVREALRDAMSEEMRADGFYTKLLEQYGVRGWDEPFAVVGPAP